MVLRKRIRTLHCGNRRGNAMVEFALVLPILLLVIFGITEFGRAWMTLNVMNAAAREGARLAAVTAPDVTAARARVTEVLAAARITPTAIDVSGPSSSDPARRITVTVDATFRIFSGRVLGAFQGTIPLRARTTMRHESL
jgi:Flp pilus assembly protein TadG